MEDENSSNGCLVRKSHQDFHMKVFEIQNGLNESIQPRLITLQRNESLLYLYEAQVDNTTLSI